jgi:uncharacterized protein
VSRWVAKFDGLKCGKEGIFTLICGSLNSRVPFIEVIGVNKYLLLIITLAFTVIPVYADESPDRNATELLRQLESLKGEEAKKNDFQDGMDAYLQRDYKTAFKNFKSLAGQGHAMAQLQLGELYELGWGVPQDYKEAVEWYRKASEQGEFRASEQLYLMYHKGRGVAKDEAEAQKWGHKASKQKQNRAVKYYRKKAEQGKAFAQFKLGEMFSQGQGVPQDDAEALKWYRKAAEQGHASAQNNLGVRYSKGQGISQNYLEAHKWFNIAESKGLEVGRQNRENIEKVMPPEQIVEAQKLAREWKPKPPQ